LRRFALDKKLQTQSVGTEKLYKKAGCKMLGLTSGANPTKIVLLLSWIILLLLFFSICKKHSSLTAKNRKTMINKDW
jgi:hypothetical protein